MLRAKNYRSLLCAPLVVLPFCIACGSSSTRPAASPSDNTEEADVSGGNDSKNDMAASPDEEGKKDDADKPDAEKKADKEASDKKADDSADGEGPRVDDSRTTANVANVFKEHRKAFKKCYEDVRKQQPELKGNVLLKVVLDGDGKVKKAYVDDESSIREPKVVDCMVKLAQGLTYPKSSKGLDKDFEYDFGFNNQTK